MTFLKDAGLLVAMGVMTPVLMAIALGSLALVGARHLYWWSRGNTTATSRVSLPAPGPVGPTPISKLQW